MLVHVREHALVILDIDHHGHMRVVLRRRPDHRRAADVDILDAVVIVPPRATVSSNG